jgi:hypothetical protein
LVAVGGEGKLCLLVPQLRALLLQDQRVERM